jgi:hypothetical protein
MMLAATGLFIWLPVAKALELVLPAKRTR